MQADLAIDQVDAMSHALEIVLSVRDDCARGGFRPDPRRNGERLHVIEIRRFAAGFQVMLAIEAGAFRG